MKRNSVRFVFIFLLLFIYSCAEKSKENPPLNGSLSKSDNKFEIETDTLNYSIKGYDIDKVVQFRNRYYCIFKRTENDTDSVEKRMIILNFKGEFNKEIPLLSEIQTKRNYNIRVVDDNLYFKGNQNNDDNYLLENLDGSFKKEQNEWLGDFNDNRYLINIYCYGEFGGAVTFKNKNTKNCFESLEHCPIIVNKLNNEYYITNYLDWTGLSSVLKISDPSKLMNKNCNLKNQAENNSKKGVKTILPHTNVNIHTSFIADKKLYHLYTDKTETYIGKIENNRLSIIYKFGFEFYPIYNQETESQKQLLTFYIPATKKTGILMIDGYNLKFKFPK